MLFLASHGYRCIAHDRRGHGRSSQPWDGNEMDTYADDLAALVEALDLRGRGACRPLDRRWGSGALHRPPRHGARGEGRVDRRRAAAHGEDARPIRAGCRSRCSTASARRRSPIDRSSSRISPRPFFGCNRPGAKVSQGVHRLVLAAGHAGRPQERLDCIKAFSETDFTADLEKFDMPTLIMHGDDDQIVPIGASAMLSAKLVKGVDAEGLPGLLARHVHDQPGPDQRGSAGLPQGVALSTEETA